MTSIYLDEVGPTRITNTTGPSCGGLSTRWSFGMETGRSGSGGMNNGGLCTTNEKMSSVLHRGGGTFRSVDTPTIWLDKGGQRVLEVGGYGFLYVRVTCGCRVLLDIGCGVRETSFLIIEGELPDSITITNGILRDVEVEVGVLRDPL